jgi:murein DD-endopeptidase MepM/ murein hydrolase activator NlpD
MSRFAVPSRSRNWPRFAVLAAIGLTAAGCADSARFTPESNTPPSDVTGSIATRPAPRVEAQPLPPPAQASGVAAGAQGLGAYQPAPRQPEYTRSVAQRPAPTPVQSQGHWTWDGGAPVVVGSGDTLESIAHKYRVPAAVILETNGIRGPVRSGQRLVIPRYVVGEVRAAHPAQQAEPSRTASVAPVRHEARSEPQAGSVYIVQPGENLIGIARKHGMSVADLARANHIEPYAKVAMGDRLTIPGRAHTQVADRTAPPAIRGEPPKAAAPQMVAPRTAPVETVRTENARVATPEPVQTPEPAVKKEPVAAVPSFRWPVTAHIVEGFGPRPNGTSNDGINFAVPEGTPVRAAEDGVVAYAGNELKTFGNLVLIRHADNYVSAYANASEILVKKGDTVRRGQIIAHSGQTGSAASPQLHFEIRKNSTPIDPRKLLAAK